MEIWIWLSWRNKEKAEFLQGLSSYNHSKLKQSKEVCLECMVSVLILRYDGACWSHTLERSQGRHNWGHSVCFEPSDLLTRENHAHSRKTSWKHFSDTLGRCFIVLWKTSLCSDQHGASKKDEKLSIVVLGESFHILRCTSPLLCFSEHEGLLPTNRLLIVFESTPTHLPAIARVSATHFMQELCRESQAGWICRSYWDWKAWCKLRGALAPLHFRHYRNIHVCTLLLGKKRNISHYSIGRVPFGVCWSDELYFSWPWVLMHVINLRVKNDRGWLGFFPLHFPCFGFLKIKYFFFQRKDRSSCFWGQWQDTNGSFFSWCLFSLWYGNQCTTAASQHRCSPDFPYS